MAAAPSNSVSNHDAGEERDQIAFMKILRLI
jgi:hypothetical protein